MLYCVSGQVKHLVVYQREVAKGKLNKSKNKCSNEGLTLEMSAFQDLLWRLIHLLLSTSR